MFERLAAAIHLLSTLAVAVTARPFPEMNVWSAGLVGIGLLQIAALFHAPLVAVATPLAVLASILATGAVLLSLLAGTIGGSFHIDPEIQPVLWALGALSVAGALSFAASRTRARGPAA